MDVLELMKSRHSVRKYLNIEIEKEKREVLDNLAKEINNDSGLNIKIVYDDPSCFKSVFSKVARFQNCSNYIVMAGSKKLEKLHEKVGYYGEKLALKAQEIGLNTCWVGLTHGKIKAKLEKDEEVVIVIALGYGAEEGSVHKSKSIHDVTDLNELPDWYKAGLEAALLAPTAINQQKFKFEYKDDTVYLIPLKGHYVLVDAGIVKYHFDIVSGKEAIIKSGE